MTRGKSCAQASHASRAFLTKDVRVKATPMRGESDCAMPRYVSFHQVMEHHHVGAINHWLDNLCKTVVCTVNSEAELVALHEKALAAGLLSHLIEDEGKTAFSGVKTKTCCAIGPAWSKELADLTDHLPLL